MGDNRTPRGVYFRCPKCRGDEIIWTSEMVWNIEAQCLQVAQTDMTGAFCVTCEMECTPEARDMATGEKLYKAYGPKLGSGCIFLTKEDHAKWLAEEKKSWP